MADQWKLVTIARQGHDGQLVEYQSYVTPGSPGAEVCALTDQRRALEMQSERIRINEQWHLVAWAPITRELAELFDPAAVAEFEEPRSHG